MIIIFTNYKASALLNEVCKLRGIWKDNMEEKPVSMEWLLDEVWGRQRPGERNLRRERDF